MKFISDKSIIKIPIKDNGEKLVNLKDYCPEIVIDIEPNSKKAQNLAEDTCYSREGVANRLKKVQESLPKGYCLMIYDSYRPLKVQKKLYADYYEQLKKKHQDWPKEKLKQETDKFVAPVEIVPPHSTGGAVDLTIFDADAKELDMGTKIDTFSKKSYTNSKEISKKAKTNRKLLIKIMKAAGFVNYPAEWWHWSYGDRYWAGILRKKYALYKGI